MTIETFTKQDFENYLAQCHSPFESLDLVDGEYAYRLPLDGQSAIIVRSSVKSDGQSASTGKDSIRAWLIGNNDKPLGSKVSKWTTRLSGWQDRLDSVLKTICEWRAMAGDCPDCNKPKGIFKSRTKANKGRIFAKCREHNGFIWLDEQERGNNVYFSEASHNNGQIDKLAEVAYSKPEKSQTDAVQSQDTDNGDSYDYDQWLNMPKMPNEKQANEWQAQAIEADVNANVRVLAPPGSGKTFVIEHRYNYLVQNGISPQKIIVVTFSKAMADEMGQRIERTCPQAEKEQISTIHALCFRLLCKWDVSSPYYKWRVPKSWEVKKTIEDIIGQVWSYGEKPGYNEVLDYIATSKYHGLSVEDSYEWFCGVLGKQHGEWLYEIRSRFDAWLKRNRSLTFADMLFLTEQRLRADEAWRTELQQKFSHIIIDESQDVNYQAMRILITISLEPGQNSVYESEVK